MFRVTFWPCEIDPLRPVTVSIEVPDEARLAVTELAPLFDPARGSLKAFVSTRVGFSLTAALRKEQRCANLSAEDEALLTALLHDHPAASTAVSADASVDEESR